MAAKPLPSQEVLNQLFLYDAQTGNLLWRHRPDLSPQWNGRYAGKPALSCVASSNGYPVGRIFKRNVLAHRVIWKMVHGNEPKQIDHANHDKRDNRLINLRAVDHAENMKNIKRRCDNTTGETGVYRHEKTGKWTAQVVIEGRSKHLGLFANFDDAVEARRLAALDHGYHKNHGASFASKS